MIRHDVAWNVCSAAPQGQAVLGGAAAHNWASTLLQTYQAHASAQSGLPHYAGTAAGSHVPKPQRLGLLQTVADSAASLVGLTPAGEAGQQSQAEAAASSMSVAAEACIGELAVVPPMLGISQRLLHRDHHKVYYEVSQLCCRLASRHKSRRGATLAWKLGLTCQCLSGS